MPNYSLKMINFFRKSVYVNLRDFSLVTEFENNIATVNYTISFILCKWTCYKINWCLQF